MITGKDIYNVLAAIVPLYVPLILAYVSVRWWKMFTPDQCSGINRFVSVFAIPFLIFKLISSNNPYTMNYPFIAADSLQKVLILVVLFLWKTFTKNCSLEWMITLFSLSTLPNTIVMGVPLLNAMYGDFSAALMVQIFVFQGLIWNTLVLVMFEYRAAKVLITERFPKAARQITSFRVESDVVSLDAVETLQVDAEIRDDDELNVVVRKSSASSMAPRTSNLSGVEIYSVQYSGRERMTRASSLNLQQEDIDEEMLKIGKKRDSGGVVTDFSEAAAIQKETASSIGVGEQDGEKKQQMPPTSVITKLILLMVWRKLIRNTNTYSSVLGIVWSLISFRWDIKMPSIVSGSITIISDTGVGMSMFCLGLFMALQPKIIACGKSVAMFSMAARFLIGPAVIAATSLAIGLRGALLHVSIVQAALPQAITSFVFAKEYNVHPDILSTSVIIGLVIALPITILYYILLGL